MNDFNPEEYWENRLKKNFGLHGVGFLKLGKKFNAWQYKVRRYVFLKKMAFLLPPLKEAKVLDVGSGTGFYIRLWKELGAKNITGLDLTSVAVQKLKNEYPDCDFHKVDIGGELDYPGKNTMDIVSSFDVLFHIVEDEKYEKAIRNISSVIKPGGYFVFSDVFVHQGSLKIPHQVCRSMSDIKKMLNDADFEIVERFPMFVLMNYPVDTRVPLAGFLWKAMAAVIMISEFFGFLIGAILYPLEICLVSLKKESPSTEIMICRKRK